MKGTGMKTIGWVKRNIRTRRKKTSEELFTDTFTPVIPKTIHIYKKENSGVIRCDVAIVKNVLLR